MDPKQLLDEINAYATEAGLSPSTVCMRIFGSGVRHRTLETEAEKLTQEHERFRRYVEAVPAASARKYRRAAR